MSFAFLCRWFGHSPRDHYHLYNNVFACRGGCEKYIDVAEILPCLRCGSVSRMTEREQSTTTGEGNTDASGWNV